MDKHIILGVHITDRLERAGDVQEVFSTFGCHIKTRLGLHEVSDNECSPNGLILLEMIGPEEMVEECEAALAAIDGVEVQKMVFDHPA
jgi:hypothetical protein